MKYNLLLFLIFFNSCTAVKKSATVSAGSSLVINGKLFASAYQQKAAEYRALCYQAYNIARLRLDQYLMEQSPKPKAIITDIDETLLDNSPSTVHQELQGKDFDQESWYDWTRRGIADTVPGSAGFLNYASAKNVTVFYITNREEKEREGTLQNLIRYNLPNADNTHLIMKQTVSSKEERRLLVMTNYDVVLFLGDNLADFSSLFDRKGLNERLQNANQIAAEFGSRFIVLPNPVYGDWESSLYNYNYRLTQAQKDSVIISVLKSY